MIEYFIENKKLMSIRFEHDPETTRLVKKLPGRYWDASSKNSPVQKWMVPISSTLYDYIFEFERETGSFIPAYILQVIIQTKQFVINNFIGSSAIAPNYNDVHQISPLFLTKLRPYQQAGVLYALLNRQVIIGDDMGLGKTIEALATVESASAYPVLIICPSVAKINWFRECSKWLPKRTAYIMDRSDQKDAENNEQLSAAQIIITNYELLEKNTWLSLIMWDCVIVDEAHYIKNSKTKRTILTEQITRNAERVILMTGTPVVNSPIDLVSLLTVSRKLHYFGGFWEFVKEYCNAQKTKFGWDFSGAENLDELNQKLRECGYLRREKKQVLPDLPEKIRQDLYIDIDNRAEYEFAKNDLLGYLRSYKDEDSAIKAERAKILVGINTLRQIAIEGKINSVFNWVDDFMKTEEKLIIFGWHTEVLDAISEKFGCGVVNGETKADERQRAIDNFQQGDDLLIVVNIKTGGVALNLTAATHELFVEFAWTSAEMVQAEDRAHRIGQTNAVNIYRMIGGDTIDELFIRLIEQKKDISDDATTNTKAIEFLIQQLLKESNENG